MTAESFSARKDIFTYSDMFSAFDLQCIITYRHSNGNVTLWLLCVAQQGTAVQFYECVH